MGSQLSQNLLWYEWRDGNVACDGNVGRKKWLLATETKWNRIRMTALWMSKRLFCFICLWPHIVCFGLISFTRLSVCVRVGNKASSVYADIYRFGNGHWWKWYCNINNNKTTIGILFHKIQRESLRNNNNDNNNS